MAALPALLEHLSDPRPTRLTVPEEGSSIMWMERSSEYAPRYASPHRHPPGMEGGRVITLARKESYGRKPHTLRIGDLCFVALGQIVNRPLSAIRYQPTGGLIINSPVEVPELAAVVRVDWAGLTAEEHALSLAQDACDSFPDATPSALKRLCFYYPEQGEPLAARYLARPLVPAEARAWSFVYLRLEQDEPPTHWPELIDEFRRTEGDLAADLVPFSLAHAASGRNCDETLAQRAGKVLAELYPTFDLYERPFFDGASVAEQARLIAGLGAIASAQIDSAVADLLRRGLEWVPGDHYSDRIAVDNLVLACLPRLIGKGHDEMIRSYLSGRIRAVESSDEKSPERYRLQSLREGLQRLGSPS